VAASLRSPATRLNGSIGRSDSSNGNLGQDLRRHLRAVAYLSIELGCRIGAGFELTAGDRSWRASCRLGSTNEIEANPEKIRSGQLGGSSVGADQPGGEGKPGPGRDSAHDGLHRGIWYRAPPSTRPATMSDHRRRPVGVGSARRKSGWRQPPPLGSVG
jgi:hypothetical protein